MIRIVRPSDLDMTQHRLRVKTCSKRKLLNPLRTESVLSVDIYRVSGRILLLAIDGKQVSYLRLSRDELSKTLDDTSGLEPSSEKRVKCLTSSRKFDHTRTSLQDLFT